MSKPSSSQTPADIAIVGMGCLFPKANHLGAYWANIKHGIDAIIETPESHWRPEDYYDADPKRPDFTYGKRGGFLEPIDFNPLEYGMPPNALEATDTAQLLGMVAADRALRDAGYGPDADFDRDRVSVVVGVTGALELVIPLGARLGHPKWRQALQDAGLDQATVDDVLERMAEQYVPWQEASFPGLLGNVVAGRITKHLNLGGTNCVVDAACASSLSAVHLAMLELQAGKSDLVISGGVDTFNDIFMFMCFSKTPALSPTGNAKPFDASGDGTILGEGLGMVALKRLSDAERDGDRVYAVLKGIGSSSDGKGDAIYAPSAKGQVKALKRAYEQANFDPRTIELVEAHGTGTAKGDAVEVNALTEVYGSATDGAWCAIGSVKSQIGHTKAASGAAALIKATLALYNKVLPPTIKITEPLGPLKAADSAFYANTKLRPWLSREGHPRRAAVSALGFGGSNFHAVLEEYGSTKAAPDWAGTAEILSFSADTPEALQRQVAEAPQWEGWSAIRLKAIELREAFDSAAPCRVTLVVEQGADLAKLVGQALSTLKSKSGEAAWSLPTGVYYGSGTTPGKLAFLFPGQGTQYVGMLGDLACQFPEFLQVLHNANEVFDGTPRLSDLIYPHPAFGAEAEGQQLKNLTATPVAPSAIGAVSAGALHVVKGFGIEADAIAGHSYGEIVGLLASGKISESDFHRLSKLRGALMGQGEGDKGSMMAVRAQEDAVEAVIAEAKLDVIIANKNAPEQMVLSGGTDAIAHADTVFSEKGIQTKVLPVAAAFHSEYVSHVAAPFLEALQGMELADGDVTLYSNTTATAYPTDGDTIRSLVAEQLAKPVSFVAQIQQMYEDGVRTFLEVGPGSRMSGLVDAILGDQPHHCVAIDGSNGKRNGILDLGRALAELSALGYGVELHAWNLNGPMDPEALKPKAKLLVPICGANHVSPRPRKAKAAPRPILAPASNPSPAPVAMQKHESTKTSTASVATTMPTGAAQIAQEHLVALQRMQQQTADLHRQFLEGQQATLETFKGLLNQQQQLLAGQPLTPMAVAPAPVAQAAPSVVAAIPETHGTNETATTASLQTPPAVQSAPATDTSAIETTLLATIAEKTGYPTEMLELGMSLDADLGIDSIKRVEILSALKEALPEAPEFGPDQLGTFHTLGDIVDYIAVNGSFDATAVAAPQASASATTDAIEAALLATIAEKTGYPTEMLELGMSLDADLGIDSIKRVEILSALKEALPEAPEFGPDQLGTFHTLGDIVEYIAANGNFGANSPVQSNTANASTGTVNTDAIETALLATIADKTGYPTEMLELTMSLDADLGIDSIKRVEILSALKEALPEAPEFGPDQLGTFHTLGDIVDYIAASGNAGVASAAQTNTTTTPAKTATSTGAVNTNTIETALLATIADKTGYPTEMLELTMSLDADLGIDSIKRVEILSALKEKLPEAPEFGPDQLGQFHTLGDIVAYIAGQGASAPVSAPTPPAPAPSTQVPSAPAAVTSAAPAATVLGDPLSLRGVTTTPYDGKNSEALKFSPTAAVLIVDGGNELCIELAKAIQGKDYAARIVGLDDPIAESIPPTLAGLVLVAPEEGCPPFFIAKAFAWLQQCGTALKAQRVSFVASITQLDGKFGTISVQGDPVAGGLAGLIKTAHHEWPGVRCKAIDIAVDTKKAPSLLTDILLSESPLEVGISRDGLCTPSLSPLELSSEGTAPIAENEVVVVTGGARGVTAEVALAMAKAWKPTLVLLGRSDAPTPEQGWLQNLESEEEIRAALLQQATGTMKPKELRDALSAIERNRAALRNIEAMEAAGATVEYFAVDIRDADAVTELLDEVRNEYGPVKGLVHGAGVLADRLIEDKTSAQFNEVYGTKIDGIQALLAAAREDDVRFMVLFSSSTGRFGRKGQIDYAAANEILNKTAQQQSTSRENCRVIAVNWGPWAGGMVTPDLAKLFKSEGVGLIGLEDGAQFVVNELSQSGKRPVEIVVMGGEIPEMTAVVRETAPAIVASTKATCPPLIDIDLNVDAFPFLASHVLNHKAVLPVAMITEWFAHTALHAHPGLRFHGLDGLRVLKGVTLDADESRTVQLCSGDVIERDGGLWIPVELRSNPTGDKEIRHASAEVNLVETLPSEMPWIQPEGLKEKAYNNGGLYDGGHLFHGPAFQGLDAVDGASDDILVALVGKAPAPKNWIDAPLRNSWLADPLILDSSFQMMILWSFQHYGVGSLPSFVGQYRQYVNRFPKEGARILIQVMEHNKRKATANIEFVDRVKGDLIARIDGYECTLVASLKAAFQNNTLEKPALTKK